MESALLFLEGYKNQKIIDELEDIKSEIKEWYWQSDKQELAKDPCVVDAMTDLFYRTVDKHITKLKGETE